LVSEAALDPGTLEASQEEDLRVLADRLLETRRVEYVDEGVLLIMNPPSFEHRETVRLIARSFERAFLTSSTAVE
jgi:Uma2 family endonuclease